MHSTRQNTKRVKVAVVDRGPDCPLPDMECVAAKVRIEARESDGWAISDSVAQGTMWAGIIQEKAPEAEIFRVQIHDEDCGQMLVKAIGWCIDCEMDIVNIGFGKADVMFKNVLLDVCRKAVRGGVVLVAAAYTNDQGAYPAVFPEVIGVADGRVDASDGYAYQKHQVIECVVDAQRSFWFNGNCAVRANFAASYMTGVVAQFLQTHPNASLQKIRHFLAVNSVGKLGRVERRSVPLSNADRGVVKLWREFDTCKWLKKQLAVAGHDTELGK